MSPLLLFDFPPKPAPDSGQPRRLLAFSAPRTVLCAERLADVGAVLRAAEAHAQAGAWVAGYVAYDAAPAFDSALRVPASPGTAGAAAQSRPLPLAWFAVFDRPLTLTETSEIEARLAGDGQAHAHGPWQSSIDATRFAEDIARLRRHIHEGDAYQINYTLRLSASFSGDPLSWFARLRRAQPDAYHACLDLGQARHILSASPELFFRRDGDRLTTRPMKGTARRGRWAAEDRQLADWLHSSEKNRAENLMIVDLLRNDLSRIALPHSVVVSKLFAVEPHPTLWQMTSTIQATARPGTTLEEIFTALFPCGSVTGAPKAKAMELIADLETEARGVYCGAIGLLQPGGDAQFSVAIRTLSLTGNTACYGTGGGITWGSTAADEYAEALLKARFLDVADERAPERNFALFETLRLENGRYWLLERHLARLNDSAAYFGYPCNLVACRAQLAELAALQPQGVWRVRLELAANGSIDCTCSHPPATPNRPRFALAALPVPRDAWWLHHKTTRRNAYEQALDTARTRQPEIFDVLLHNEQGELTEFTRGNLVVEIAGQRYTPPQDSGLLGGVLRAELLAAGRLQERVLTLDDLANAERILFINSLRGEIAVEPSRAIGPTG